MAETAQTMTEFTYAPGEKNIVGDRFSPSVIIFWLKTSIAASSTRVQYRAPNTLFGLIPLGASTKTIPLRNIASVDTNTKFNLGSLVWGLLFLFVGFGMFNSNALVAIVFPLMMKHIGGAGTYLIFSLFNVGSLLFYLKVVPETKYHSLEELEERFEREYS